MGNSFFIVGKAVIQAKAETECFTPSVLSEIARSFLTHSTWRMR